MRIHPPKQTLSALLLLILFCGGAMAQTQLLIKSESATLREKQDMKSKALEKLQRFTPLTLVERGGEWSRVKTQGGKTGFVLTRLLSRTGFISTDENQANVYRGPGSEYAIIMNYGKNFPLKVLDIASNGWLKVMDFEGDRGWVSPKSATADPVYVITRQPQVNVRQQPGTESPKVFSAEKGVIFKALEERDGWLNVKHPDGDSGWISAKIVYGWLDVDEPGAKPVARAETRPSPTPTPKAAAARKSGTGNKPARPKTNAGKSAPAKPKPKPAAAQAG